MRFIETLEGTGRLTRGTESCMACYRLDFWSDDVHEVAAMGNINADFAELPCRVGQIATLQLVDGRLLTISFLAISPDSVLFVTAGVLDDVVC